jgi:hypothetical protein
VVDEKVLQVRYFLYGYTGWGVINAGNGGWHLAARQGFDLVVLNPRSSTRDGLRGVERDSHIPYLLERLNTYIIMFLS